MWKGIRFGEHVGMGVFGADSCRLGAETAVFDIEED
jgi:hypothetical protein